MIYSYIKNNTVKENANGNMFDIVSVAYDEYCNYSSMLESCTDDNERAILEAKCEVLYEVSFKDIVEKLKKMWEDFKAWVKKVWNAIFHNKKATDKVADDLTAKVKKDMDEFFKDLDKAMDDEFSGKNRMKKAGVLADLKIPVYYADELDRLTDNSMLFKNGFASGGELMDNVEARYALDSILDISMINTIIDIDDDEKDIHIHYNDEKSMSADSVKKDIENLQKKIEKIDNISIELVPIVENKNNSIFTINNRLRKYNIKFDDGVSEELLRKVYGVYTDILEGFKHDYIKVYGYKTQIDKNISNWDRKIKQLLNEMHNEIDTYRTSSEKYAKSKAEQDYIASDPYKDYREYQGAHRRVRDYKIAVHDKKYAGWKKYNAKNKTVKTHDSVTAIRDLIRNLQKATNAISGLSAKVVSAEQKTTVQLGKLDKIILDMSDKTEKKDENEI